MDIPFEYGPQLFVSFNAYSPVFIQQTYIYETWNLIMKELQGYTNLQGNHN